MKISKIMMPVVAILIGFGAASQSDAQTIPFWAFGTNSSYFPAADGSGGPYEGIGFGFPLGIHFVSGNLAVTPTDDPLVFDWETTEPQISIGFLGSILFESVGSVQLIPELDQTGNPTGVFTAEWTADFTVVGGTGLFSSVQPAGRPLRVVAVNEPFRLSDPEWKFSWTLNGRIRLF